MLNVDVANQLLLAEIDSCPVAVLIVQEHWLLLLGFLFIIVICIHILFCILMSLFFFELLLLSFTLFFRFLFLL